MPRVQIPIFYIDERGSLHGRQLIYVAPTKYL